MAKICYIPKDFRGKSEQMIALCNRIIAEFAKEGFELTLRQLYYQLVSKGIIKNSEKSYDNLGALILDARPAGMVDWDAIVDRTRYLRSLSHWGDPSSIVQDAAKGFNYDLWADQPRRVEVWIEKDALVGVIGGVCQQLDVPFFSCRGYTSQSEMWSAAQRIQRYYDDASQECTIIHLEDHDPSGKDMSRDIEDRLTLFCEKDGYPAPELRRIALNMDQIRKYNPPPNPAKLSDCRAKAYIAEYGPESWELDALSPRVITDMLRDVIREYIDGEKFNAALDRQREARRGLQQIADQYPTISKWLAKKAGKKGKGRKK